MILWPLVPVFPPSLIRVSVNIAFHNVFHRRLRIIGCNASVPLDNVVHLISPLNFSNHSIHCILLYVSVIRWCFVSVSCSCVILHTIAIQLCACGSVVRSSCQTPVRDQNLVQHSILICFASVSSYFYNFVQSSSTSHEPVACKLYSIFDFLTLEYGHSLSGHEDIVSYGSHLLPSEGSVLVLVTMLFCCQSWASSFFIFATRCCSFRIRSCGSVFADKLVGTSVRLWSVAVDGESRSSITAKHDRPVARCVSNCMHQLTSDCTGHHRTEASLHNVGLSSRSCRCTFFPAHWSED